MQATRSIHVVDSHTMGEPTRVVVGGIPNIPGKTMAEKKKYLQENMDDIRTSLMHEPRGHNDMFGSIMTTPVNDEADFGIIFMDGGGYLNMCGHGSIGAVTIAIETGMVKAKEPITEVTMDTPAGLVKAKAKVQNGKVKEVSIVNVPAFHYKELEIEVPELGKIKLDISFGGSFFAIVNAKELGLKVKSENISKLIDLGMKIRDIINKNVEIKHPNLEHIKTVDLVEIYDEPTHPKANLKNVVIFGEGQFDRSPCGTGTSAKLATLYSKGHIKENENFIYESILGTLFKGRILGTTKVGNYEAVIPEITGAAYITAFNQFIIDPEDPVKHGFLVK
ncbi:proline racemase [Thermohalobacter berrensis]|uniref:Proline racemase n=1 Tax=Thermohalobacter berrensis TaxID=99594 RepID=A0A419T8C7_9FIRM|nr:proline racemase [Thermohalobacter berrensis]RKD33804.1 proline racemase [Thermohalobacter berrensis]